MKKIIFIALLAMVSFGFFSCERNQEPCKFHTQTLDLTVKQADWQWDENTEQFYFHFDVPELTWDIYDYGNWTICREYNYGTADAYQVALPESSYMWENVEDTVTHEVTTVYYTQHIDYRIGVGYVEIQLTNSDYTYAAENPETMHFRLQLIY